MLLNTTLREIAKYLKGDLSGDPTISVERLWPLRSATSKDLSFIYSPKYLKFAASSDAAALIVALDSKIMHPNLIRVSNPSEAIERLIELFSDSIALMTPQIDPTAKIDPNVTIYPNVTIGKNVRIKAGAVIGSDGFGFKKENAHWLKVPQVGSVVIEDDVEIGANTCIDRARIGETRIGRGTKIDNLVQIGHGVHIGEDCLICGCCGLAGSVVLGDRVTLAGSCGVADHVTIASDVTVGLRSVITSDISETGRYWGVGPLKIREALKCEAIYRRLPKLLRGNRH